MKRKYLLISIIVAILLIIALFLFKNLESITSTNKKELTTIKLIDEYWFVDNINEKMTKEKKVQEYHVKEGQNITYSDLTIQIKEITPFHVKIKTSEELSDSGSVLEGKTEFTINQKDSIKLNTLTMDAGHTYTIKVN